MTSSSQAAPAFVRLASHPLRWRLLADLAGGDLRVRELVTLTGQAQNLISHHHLDLDRCAETLPGTGTALHPALRMTPARAPSPTTT